MKLILEKKPRVDIHQERDRVGKHRVENPELFVPILARRQAFFPLKGLLEDKCWPPVGRIDNIAGDRNLVCSCPPMEDYAEAAE